MQRFPVIRLPESGGIGSMGVQELSAQGEFLFPMRISQEALMPDAYESAGQDMQQEAAYEFMGLQGHVLLLIAVLVIPPAKSHLAILKTDQPVVGNGNAMGIAAQIVQRLMGAAKRGLGINHPFDFAAVF